MIALTLIHIRQDLKYFEIIRKGIKKFNVYARKRAITDLDFFLCFKLQKVTRSPLQFINSTFNAF